jgi:gas vesicle protein
MPRDGRSFLAGVISGVAVCVGTALVLSPEIKKKLKPMLVKGMKKTAELTENVKTAAAKAVEDWEDLIAEAKYEAVKHKEPENVNLGEILAVDQEKH